METTINHFANEYNFLSNFYMAPVVFEDLTYPSVEHAFQAAKTIDSIKRKQISQLKTPSEAKKAGRRVPLRNDWENIKNYVMYECLKSKFADPKLKQMLMETKPATLIEGNHWHDNYWGDCFCSKCQHVVGHNMLGKILMRIRSEIG